MFYELNPVNFQITETPPSQRMNYLDAARLDVFDGMEYYRNHPMIAFAALALTTFPLLVRTNAQLTDQGSALSQSLASFGLLVDHNLPKLASFGLDVEALLANVITLQAPSSVPIINACQEAIALATQGLILGGGAIGLLRENIAERHSKRMADGVEPVSRIFPVGTVFIGNHEIIDGIQRAGRQEGHAPNPSVFIDPTNGSYKPAGYMPFDCRYWFRGGLEGIDDRHRYQEGRFRRKPLDVMGMMKGNVFASTRLPGHELFAGGDHSAFHLHSFQTMATEMNEIRPGMWRNKQVVLDTPRSERMGGSYRDGIAGISRAVRELGGEEVVATDTEGVFISEVARILRERRDLVDNGGGSNDGTFSIAIAPTSRADPEAVKRMAEALRQDTPDQKIGVDIISEGIQIGDGSHDMIVVTGEDQEVYGLVTAAVGDGRVDRRGVWPVVDNPVSAHRFTKLIIPSFDATHAINASAESQTNRPKNTNR